MDKAPEGLVSFSPDGGIWERTFMLFPLVVVGSVDQQGTQDLAPKHMAIPLSWQNHFGFVCTPNHQTYKNIKTSGEFTVSYPKPSQVVFTSLAASPREACGEKAITEALPTFAASKVQGAFLADGYLYLECRLHQIIDGFGNNSLIAGEVVQVHVVEEALRANDIDDQQLLQQCPLLAYLHPRRFSQVSESMVLPFPQGFKR